MQRRRFVTSLPLAVIGGSIALTRCAAASSEGADEPPTPVVPGVFAGLMPDEGDQHLRTWMAFTTSTAIWGRDLPAVQSDLIAIADAIAAFEPVTMLVMEGGRATAQTLLDSARNRANISLLSAELNDLWMRDTGPVFAKNRTGSGYSAVDFNFNGWGNKQTHTLDAKVAAFVAASTGVSRIQSTLRLEGGGLEVDGDGTAIVKESCVLNDNRNPGISKAQCETELRRLLGLDKIIWLPGPAGGDITDAHTDFYARFAQPGTVVVSHDANDVYGERSVTQRHIDTLRSATDAKGRTLAIEVINVPENPSSPSSSSKDFAAGYINYYVCNRAVIMPKFGDLSADESARAKLAVLYPSRTVVTLTINAIAKGGGGIHCTTQQQPMG